MKKNLTLLITHIAFGVFGFALGIYLLPILTAPDAPTEAEVRSVSAHSSYTGDFKKDLQDSDAFHWGEGKVSVGVKHIALMGKLAPGPDYRLYLSPEFVETEADFMRLKHSMAEVASIRTFSNFVVEVPAGIDIEKFNSVIIWCETFEEFISAAQYR